MSLAMIYQLLLTAQSSHPHFPPTILYNEGWLTRLVLGWFHKSHLEGHTLSFAEGATWYSEAQPPTPFRARRRGDTRAESRTHVDGLLGHVHIGTAGKTDVSLRPDATQLVVIEAKIYAPLSLSTKNAPGYGQAARNLACMAEMLSLAQRDPHAMNTLAFIVLAPAAQIERSLFSGPLEKPTIRQSVTERARHFGAELDDWLTRWFEPCLETATIAPLSWEDVLTTIGSKDPDTQASLAEFYARCLEPNAPPKR